MASIISVIFPILAGFVILLIKNLDGKKLKTYTFSVGLATLCIVIINNLLCYEQSINAITFAYNLGLNFNVDSLSIIFSTVFSVIWFLVLIFSYNYIDHIGEQRRYFVYYLALGGSLLMQAYANDPFTFYMGFELMTLFGYVLIVQDRSFNSFMGARKYLYFSIFGACLGLIALFYVYSIDPNITFTAGGAEALRGISQNNTVLAIAFVAIIGFGCKLGI